MELIKNTIPYATEAKPIVTQLTFDDDINVPDGNDDIKEIIIQKGHVRIEEARVITEKVKAAGHLEFSVLYSSEEEGNISCVHGDFSFEETIHYEEGKEGDYVMILWNIEDLRAQLIHSRKINVKAVVTLTIYPSRQGNIYAVTGIENEENAETLTTTEQFAGLKICGRDTIRVKESFFLGNQDSDIERIIFQDVKLKNIKTRAENGQINIDGDIALFIFYISGDENMKNHWVEHQFKINNFIEVSDSTNLMQSASFLQLLNSEITVQEDEDGEMRCVTMEAVLQCDIMLYEEQNVELLLDAYVPKKEFDIKCQDIDMAVLGNCIDSRTRMTFSMTFNASKPLIQIVYADSAIKVEEIKPSEEGILLEGIISVDVLYQQADNNNPIAACHQDYPFSYTVNITPTDKILENQMKIMCSTEQLNVVLSGADGAEIRLTAGFHIVMTKVKKIMPVIEMDMSEVPMEKIENMAGITGYLVKPKDTLWSVARKFYVPLSSIREVNDLTSDDLKPGQKLLIVR